MTYHPLNVAVRFVMEVTARRRLRNRQSCGRNWSRGDLAQEQFDGPGCLAIAW
jgi:hypothetical protein